jgi:Icc-related predicted phosphoesterase
MTTNTRSTFGNSSIFAPEVPSAWQRLQRDPLLFIAQWLYAHQPAISKSKTPISAMPVKVVCISDTHNEQPRIPNGDIVIHAGDMTVNGTFKEIQEQLDWLNSLPHRHKVVIAGNHDLLLDQSFFRRNPRLMSPENNEHRLKQLRWGSVVYLEDESKVLDVRNRDVKVYGSPMTPKYGNWAFQYQGEDAWSNKIPQGTDILVTHGPAKGHVDSSPSNPSYLQGCTHLQQELWRIRPRLHVCGHIHAARGVERGDWGWTRWGYDAACRGERGTDIVLVMWAGWIYSWILCICGRERKGTMTSVNAAVVGDRELAEGEQTILVHIL